MTVIRHIVTKAAGAVVHVGCVLALVAAGVLMANAPALAPMATLGPTPSCLPQALRREGPPLVAAPVAPQPNET